MDDKKWTDLINVLARVSGELMEINEGLVGIISALGDLVEQQKNKAEAYEAFMRLEGQGPS